jgi:dihydrolipoamide dehydrogenase
LDLYKGKGVFIDDYKMEIFDQNDESIGKLEGKKFLLASGARPLIPPIEGLKDAGYVSTKTFFGEKFPKKPWKSLIIIGGGIIAAEFAHIFSALGTEVTIVEMLPRLVSTEEPEISHILEDKFREVMNVHLNKRAIKVQSKKNGKTVTLEDVNTGKHEKIRAEEILVATGRRSNADLLEVKKAGIKTDDKGWIKTNEFLETNVKNIWCIGDANGKYQFRHKGNYESELVAYNIFGDAERKRKADYSSVPWAVFTYPQIGHVGMTQEEAVNSGHKILVAKNRYSSIAKGFAMGLGEGDPENGLVKLVIDQSYKILGAHIIGPSAATLIQQFVYLMNSGYRCKVPEEAPPDVIPKSERACPEAGSFMPIYNSMVIHPSLNEVAAWALGNLQPVNIQHEHHHH